MKKILANLCVLAMVFSFAACDSEKEESKSSYKNAVKNYEKVMNGDMSQAKKLAPDEVWEVFEETTGDSVEEYIEELEELYDDLIEDMKDEFGKDFKFTVSVTDEEKCDGEMLDKIAAAINEQYDIKESDVKAAYEATLVTTGKGSENSETQENEILIIQIRNSWYLASYSEYDENFYVRFLIS